MRALSDPVPGTIRLGEWDFHPIELEDIRIYSDLMRHSECPANLWSANFAFLWASSQSRLRRILWRMVDGMLVTFAHSYKDSLYLFCPPFGPGDPDQVTQVLLECMHNCLDWNQRENRRTMLRIINHDQLDFLRVCPDFERNFRWVAYQGIERHLDVGRLALLAGKDFSTVRNKLNRFRRDHPDAIVRRYRKEDYPQLLELARRWADGAGKRYDKIFDKGYYRSILDHHEELNQWVWVVAIGERIVGMVSGEILPTGQAWGSLLKYEEGFPGLSELLAVEFVREIHRIDPGVGFLNIGSDLGKGGLRDYKMKFRPALNLKRYQVYLKRQD